MVACDAGGRGRCATGPRARGSRGSRRCSPTAVVIDGIGGLLKDNAGYDLPALLVGSEGTLGRDHAVLWRLVPRLTARVAALVAARSLGAAAELLAELRPRLPSLEAATSSSTTGCSWCSTTSASRRRSPRAPVYVAARVRGGAGPDRRSWPRRSATSTTRRRRRHAERERLWRCARRTPRRSRRPACRTSSTSACRSARLARVRRRRACRGGGRRARRARDPLRPPRRRQRARQRPRRRGRRPRRRRRCSGLAADHGGTISAEHGVGVAKAAGSGWCGARPSCGRCAR